MSVPIRHADEWYRDEVSTFSNSVVAREMGFHTLSKGSTKRLLEPKPPKRKKKTKR